MFQKGDFIVEYQRVDRTGEIKFGVVMDLELGFQDMLILDVLFATDRLYTFASHCQPYEEWLDEQRV
jgi:hypothetical protein|tara:strand:+ start:1111 stop:1311 length:201 start_codon:yes stop_codon:yes gene_type:complete